MTSVFSGLLFVKSNCPIFFLGLRVLLVFAEPDSRARQVRVPVGNLEARVLQKEACEKLSAYSNGHGVCDCVWVILSALPNFRTLRLDFR